MSVVVELFYASGFRFERLNVLGLQLINHLEPA
jgi:hypothetical protein